MVVITSSAGSVGSVVVTGVTGVTTPSVPSMLVTVEVVFPYPSLEMVWTVFPSL